MHAGFKLYCRCGQPDSLSVHPVLVRITLILDGVFTWLQSNLGLRESRQRLVIDGIYINTTSSSPTAFAIEFDDGQLSQWQLLALVELVHSLASHTLGTRAGGQRGCNSDHSLYSFVHFLILI